MAELSIVIPAKNEEFLNRTVEDALAHAERDTEIIVIADGGWPPIALDTHPKVQVLYVPTSIGQRAATNIGVKLSTAKYIMKADAHVGFSQGFDRVLIDAAEKLGPNVVQIPAQRHLHVYDQVCPKCKHRADQAPHWNGRCPKCNREVNVERVIIWEPRRKPTTTAWRFDHALHFQYWGEGQKRQGDGDIHDVMTSLGACFFMRRDYYEYLGGFDEAHGSWGQYGVELALQCWLSGGRHVVNRAAWFMHFFRVGGIGFSHPVTNADQERARKYSRDLWFNNKFSKQIRPLKWVLDKFGPLPDWNDQVGAEALTLATKAAVRFTPVRVAAFVESGLQSEGSLIDQAALTADSKPRAVREVAVVAEQVAPDAVSLGSVDARDSVGASEVVALADQPKMTRVAAERSVAEEVIEDRSAGGRMAHRQRGNQPGVHQPVDTHGGWPQLLEADLPVSALAATACPDPAAGGLINGDLSEQSREDSPVDVGDCEIVGISHASALNAGVRSGPSVRLERIGGPSSIGRKLSAGAVYFSDCLPDPAILQAVRQSIQNSGLPIVAVTLAPIDWPAARSIVMNMQRGCLSMFKQILAGLEALDTDVAFLTEHDCLYHASGFEFRPPRKDVYYYQTNTWKLNADTGHAVTYETKQTSGLCANRQLLVDHYRKRVAIVEASCFNRRIGFEPGSHRRPERIDDFKSEAWRSAFPNVDIRHGRNLTASRWSQAEFRDQRNCRGWQEAGEIPGWGITAGRFAAWLAETTAALSDDRHRELEVELTP